MSPRRLRRAASLHDRLGKLIREHEEADEGEWEGEREGRNVRRLRRRHTLSRLPQSAPISAPPGKGPSTQVSPRPLARPTLEESRRETSVKPLGISTQMVGFYLALGLGVPIFVLLLYLSVSTLCFLSITLSIFVLSEVASLLIGFIFLLPVVFLVLGSGMILWGCMKMACWAVWMAKRGGSMVGLF